VLETKGGFYITQIKQLHDRIFERLLLENGMEISGGQGRILFILWQRDYLTKVFRNRSRNNWNSILHGY